VTDYGDENPLLYDYYGFQPKFYELKFKSRGDSALAQRVVDLYKSVILLVHLLNSLANLEVIKGW
jgi:aromatic ring-opening dioxygenase catalytic subunit (LigB family)